jgi:phage RecT family recombinase
MGKAKTTVNLAELKKALDSKSLVINSVLPDVGLNAEKVIAAACITARKRELDGSVASFVTATIEAAQLGLLVDDHLAYFIPSGGGVQFRPSYMGMVAIARRTKNISDIWAREVYGNDDFEHGQDGPTCLLKHSFKFGADRGELIGVYGILVRTDGSWIYDLMDMDTLSRVESCSRSGGNKFPEEMRKKAVIKRMLKSYRDDPHLSAVVAADDKFFDPAKEPALKSGDTVSVEDQIDLNELAERLAGKFPPLASEVEHADT